MSANLVKAIILAGVLSCLVFSESCTRVASCQYPTSYQYWFVCTKGTDTIEVKGNAKDFQVKQLIKDSVAQYQATGYQVVIRYYFQAMEGFCGRYTGKKCIQEAEDNGARCSYGYSANCAYSSVSDCQ